MKTIVNILALCICLQAFSQKLTIKGYVHDQEANDAFIGATVMIKGTTEGTVTDFTGQYTISADYGDTLRFSFIGYCTKEVILSKDAEPGLKEIVFGKKEKRRADPVQQFITADTEINIMMEPDIQMIDVVEIVDYSPIKKVDITGAIDILSDKELGRRASDNVITSLEGKMSGVKVQKNCATPGGDITINIRGISSLTNSNPLYVVDGVPSESIKGLNPADIATIAVLKDGSSCAMYGSRGANGVILISTKGGMKRTRSQEEIFFLGLKNSVRFQSANDATKSYEVQCSKGKIVKENDEFIYIPSMPGYAQLEVIEKDLYGRILNTSTIKCLVKKLPKPVGNLGGKYRGFIDDSELESIEEITLRYVRDFDIAPDRITAFSLTVNGKTIESDSGVLTGAQKSLLKNAKTGDSVTVSDIKIRNEKGKVRTAGAIRLRVI